MIKTFLKVLTLFDRTERRTFYFLMCFMVLVAFAEVAGIASVLLFLNVLSDPAKFLENSVFAWLYGYFQFADLYAFQIFLSVAVFFVVLTSLAVKAFGAYIIIRFATMRGYSLSTRLLHTYLNRPYAWFLQKNSADIAKNVLGEVDTLVARVIVPFLRLIAGIISVLAIVLFLLIVDPYVCIFSAGVLGVIYAALYLKLRKTFKQIGADMLQVNKERYRLVSEVTGGFKQVKLSGLEGKYAALFRKPARKRADYLAINQILGELPRFALEALTFGILLTLILVLLLRNSGDLAAIIPTLGVFAFAVIRLLPSVQRIYFSLVSIRSGEVLLDQMVETYSKAKNRMPEAEVETTSEVLPLTENLTLSDISFSYGQSSRQALHEIGMRISAYSTIGIVGGTGAGKTTLIDLILGLLPIQNGTMNVDGIPITNENRRAWQNTIGYVPQEIFLTDDTIERNIAFGVPSKDIDPGAVENAARIAALHNFIATELSEGYQTMVGERGVRLSGGQRQRIGIARALYANPSLLIMDEATSALDNITERIVMEAVQNIRSDKTVILIAHRLSTVKECDRIFLMENGKVVSAGTYEELVQNNETFREMARHT